MTSSVGRCRHNFIQTHEMQGASEKVRTDDGQGSQLDTQCTRSFLVCAPSFVSSILHLRDLFCSVFNSGLSFGVLVRIYHANFASVIEVR